MANTVGFELSNTEIMTSLLEDNNTHIFVKDFVAGEVSNLRLHIIDNFLEYVQETNNSITIPSSNDAIIQKAIDIGVVNTYIDANTVNLSSNATYTVDLSNSDILVLITETDDIQTYLSDELHHNLDSILYVNYESYLDYKREEGSAISINTKEEFLEVAIAEGFLSYYDDLNTPLIANNYY